MFAVSGTVAVIDTSLMVLPKELPESMVACVLPKMTLRESAPAPDNEPPTAPPALAANEAATEVAVI